MKYPCFILRGHRLGALWPHISIKHQNLITWVNTGMQCSEFPWWPWQAAAHSSLAKCLDSDSVLSHCLNTCPSPEVTSHCDQPALKTLKEEQISLCSLTFLSGKASLLQSPSISAQHHTKKFLNLPSHNPGKLLSLISPYKVTQLQMFVCPFVLLWI